MAVAVGIGRERDQGYRAREGELVVVLCSDEAWELDAKLGYELHELWPQRRAQPRRRAMAMVVTMATGTETVGNGGEMTACSPWRHTKAR